MKLSNTLRIPRTIQLKVILDPKIKNELDLVISKSHSKMLDFGMAIIALRGEETHIRREKTIEILDSGYWKEYRKDRLGDYNEGHEEKLKSVFDAVAAKGKTRDFLCPIFRKITKANASNLSDIKALRQDGVLPFALNTTELTSTDHVNDYACWRSITSHIAGWKSNDARTKSAYSNLLKVVGENTPDEVGMGLLNELIDKFGSFITEKFLKKFTKFGFDIRSLGEEMAWAKSKESKVSIWKKLFRYQIAKTQLDRSRPMACLNLPDGTTHTRQIPYGDCYVPFAISIDGNGEFFVSLGTKTPIKLKCMKTNHIRDVKITYETVASPTKQNPEKTREARVFYFRRGNHSDKQLVRAELAEIALQRNGDDYYIVLPLQIDIERNVNAVDLYNRRFEEPKLPYAPLATNQTITCLDLGIDPLGAFGVWTIEGGRKIEIAKGAIGGVVDSSYNRKIRELRSKMRKVGQIIDYLKVVQFGKEVPSRNREKWKNAFRDLGVPVIDDFLSKSLVFDHVENKPWKGKKWTLTIDSDVVDILRTFISEKKRECDRTYRELKRYDIYPSRHCGVASETFGFACLVKEHISLTKKWKFYGRPPLGKFELRAGFESETEYLKNLKKDSIKKNAHAFVNDGCLKYGSKTIVIENLDFNRSGNSSDNEFLALWSSNTLIKWINHFADQYGIVVATVNKWGTSQRDPVTGLWGFRPKDQKWHSYGNKKDLNVRRDGKIVTINSDIDAATENLLNVYLDPTFHVYSMRVEEIADPGSIGIGPGRAFKPVWKEELESEDSASSKKWKLSTIKHQLIRMYNSYRVFILESGDVINVSADLFLSVKTKGEEQTFTREGVRWISRDQRDEIESQIREKMGCKSMDLNWISANLYEQEVCDKKQKNTLSRAG
jgi:IS605 OrfB family transposase